MSTARPFSICNRRGAFVALVATVALSLAAGVLPAHAAGSTPSSAPAVRLGVPYAADNFHCPASDDTGFACQTDMYRLPDLLLNDRVTVAWKYLTPEGPRLCITGSVDDYSWLDNVCNRSINPLTNESYAFSNTSGRRTTFTVPTAASPALLTFYDGDGWCRCNEHGTYQFTVEKIQHRLLVALPAKHSVRRNGKLSIRPTLINGRTVPRATFKLTITWPGHSRVRMAKVSASTGKATFKLKLPKSAKRHRAKFAVHRGATSTTTAASSTVRIKVK